MTVLRNDEPMDPELCAEQEYMDACRRALTRMRAEVDTMLATGTAEGDAVADKYVNHTLRQSRLKLIKDLSGHDAVPLFFGRLDFPMGHVYGFRVGPRDSPTHRSSGDLVYIGRRGIREDDGEPMVVDWRAQLSHAFYEASSEDTMGVRVRRRYGFDADGAVTAFEDEPLDGTAGPGGSDLLAAEIERPRRGPMRDIVATIQPEQMRLVRAPLGRTMCVQGAPGTGKTAVGLHRLAYLLFAERDRLRKEGGVAVVGPNRSFLSYIRNVLPALGEVSVSQSTVAELIGPDVVAVGVDDVVSSAVKGDARMAEVIRRDLRRRIEPIDEPIEVKHGSRTWRLHPEDIAEGLDAALGRDLDYYNGRDLLAERLALRVLRQMERFGSAGTASVQKLKRNRGLTAALRRIWPTVDPRRLVFELVTNPAQLARAAEGILSPDEQLAVLKVPRPRSLKTVAWTVADLALLDEAASQVRRPPRLGHVVVDEAQDLSPMEIRAIGCRVSLSCTVLGDLAQATSPSAVPTWSAVLKHLGTTDGHIEELTRGYRVPAEVIGFAARLLPHIDPGLSMPTSFRATSGALNLVATMPAEAVDVIARTCAEALAGQGSVGVIAADHDIPELDRALSTHGLRHALLGTDEEALEAERLVLSPVSLVKGLEFDVAVVVEPAHIVAAAERGPHRLYVALTRAVSALHVIHAKPLPDALQTAS